MNFRFNFEIYTTDGEKIKLMYELIDLKLYRLSEDISLESMKALADEITKGFIRLLLQSEPTSTFIREDKIQTNTIYPYLYQGCYIPVLGLILKLFPTLPVQSTADITGASAEAGSLSLEPTASLPIAEGTDVSTVSLGSELTSTGGGSAMPLEGPAAVESTVTEFITPTTPLPIYEINFSFCFPKFKVASGVPSISNEMLECSFPNRDLYRSTDSVTEELVRAFANPLATQISDVAFSQLLLNLIGTDIMEVNYSALRELIHFGYDVISLGFVARFLPIVPFVDTSAVRGEIGTPALLHSFGDALRNQGMFSTRHPVELWDRGVAAQALLPSPECISRVLDAAATILDQVGVSRAHEEAPSNSSEDIEGRSPAR